MSLTPNDAIQHLSLMRADIMKLEKNNFNETRVKSINMAIEALRMQIKNKKESKNDNN